MSSDVVEPIVEMMRLDWERRRVLDARRAGAAFALAPTLTIAQALYRGRHVPREALDEDFRERVVCWDGVLTDEIALDVAVLLDADREAGQIAAPPPITSLIGKPELRSSWRPKLA